MIAYPFLLAESAHQAGILVPEDTDNYDPEAFVRFHIFCCVQLGRAMPGPTAHWDNAKIIADIPEEELKTITMSQLLDRGLA